MTPIVDDPVQRVRYRFTRTGQALRTEVWADPGGGAPVEHVHPGLEETFEVIQGEVTLRAGGQDLNLGPGQLGVAGPGARHRFVNTGRATAYLIVTIDPALRMQEFLTDAATLARDGCYTRRGVPRTPRGVLRVARLARTYRDSIVLTGGAAPPPAWQPAIFTPLAWLARRLNL